MSLPTSHRVRTRAVLAITTLPLVLAACPALGNGDRVPREDLVAACQGYDAALAQLAQLGATVTMHPTVREAADAACDRMRTTGP